MSQSPKDPVTLSVNPTLLACARMAAFQRRCTTQRLLAEIIEAYIAGERSNGHLPLKVRQDFVNPVDFEKGSDDEDQECEAVQ